MAKEMDEQLKKLKETMAKELKEDEVEEQEKEKAENKTEETQKPEKEEKAEKNSAQAPESASQPNTNRKGGKNGKKNGKRGSAGANNPAVKALEVELQKQKELVLESQDRYKRLLAEFENARAREAKEASKMYDVGAKSVLEQLLPVVDNFERALESVSDEDKERAFEQGVDKIYKQMMVTLEKVGVYPMNAEGTEFNPDFHNAVMHVEDEELGDNVVAEELQKGYMYKESVLRHSMVKVAN